MDESSSEEHEGETAEERAKRREMSQLAEKNHNKMDLALYSKTSMVRSGGDFMQDKNSSDLEFRVN